MKVSILCTVYNHEKYLEKCLQSLVEQCTNFDYEIIVHDDASTDGSKLIIQEYEKKYPGIIKPIYQTENQRKQGKSSLDAAFYKSKGEYIAICEGDDFWTDSMKLQIQVDQLDKNPNIDLCFHRGQIYNNNSKAFYGHIGDYGSSVRIIPDEILIPMGGNAMATNSIMLRRKAYERRIEFFRVYIGRKPVGDFIIQTIGAENGAIYIPRDMCAYRTNVSGSWTDRQSKSGWEKEIAFKQAMSNMYDALDYFLSGKFHNAFIKRKIADGKDVLFNTTIPGREKMHFLKSHGLLRIELLILLPIGICVPIVKILKTIKRRLRRR